MEHPLAGVVAELHDDAHAAVLLDVDGVFPAQDGDTAAVQYLERKAVQMASRERTRAALRAALGEAAFTAAHEEGRAMPLLQAIRCALEESG